MPKIIVILCFALVACNGPSKKAKDDTQAETRSNSFLNKAHLDTLKEVPFVRIAKQEKINDSLLSIEVLEDILVHWNTRTQRIQEDSLFQKIKTEFYRFKMDLANEIRNTAPTEALACPENSVLKVGDICFLVIDRIENIPLAHLTNFQLDAFQAGCPHPYGLFTLLEKHRAYMTKCVKDFLYNQSKF